MGLSYVSVKCEREERSLDRGRCRVGIHVRWRALHRLVRLSNKVGVLASGHRARLGLEREARDSGEINRLLLVDDSVLPSMQQVTALESHQ